MKRLIWLPIAGFLLITGAAVATAAPAVLEAAKGVVAAASPAPVGDPTAGPTTAGAHAGFGDGLLRSVLSDLVTKGTITQAQSDAITQGLQDELAQRQTDAEARRTLIEGFIADGVITQDEVNQLPADDPLRVAFDSIANDGQISLDQLRNLGPFGGPGGPGGPFGGPGGPGMHRGPGGDWDNPANPAPSASPSASSTNS
ncbi:MAG: hypothetical protein ABI744_03690 [Chloroflexota bacterium]